MPGVAAECLVALASPKEDEADHERALVGALLVTDAIAYLRFLAKALGGLK